RLLLGASLGGVALLGTWGSIQWAPTWAYALEPDYPQAKAYTQIFGAAGAIVGTIAAAIIADYIGRRITYFAMCLGALGSSLMLFQLNNRVDGQFLAS